MYMYMYLYIWIYIHMLTFYIFLLEKSTSYITIQYYVETSRGPKVVPPKLDWILMNAGGPGQYICVG